MPRPARCPICSDLKRDQDRYCYECSSRIPHMMRRYQLTRHEAEQLWGSDICSACGQGHTGAGKNGMHVDHCHTTGKVRGLLHAACNKGIALADEDLERLHAWATYLAHHQLDLRDHCTQ